MDGFSIAFLTRLITHSNIWAVAADPGSGKPLGPPTRLANVAPDAQDFRASADGKRFTYQSLRSKRRCIPGQSRTRSQNI